MIIVLCVLGGLILFLLAAGYVLYRFIVIRRDLKPQPTPEKAVNDARRYFAQNYTAQMSWLQNWGYEIVSIQSADGTPLVGYFFRAQMPTCRTALAIHGYRCNGGFDEYMFLAPMYLEEFGMNLLLVDDYAHGQSGGTHIGFGWKDRLDCMEWARWIECKLNAEIGACEILMQGISMGAATVLMAAGDTALPSSVKWVVADCGYTSMRNEVRFIMKALYNAPAFPLYSIASGWCRLLAGYSFEEPDTLAYTRNIKVPVLFIHGDEDKFVPTTMQQPLYDACRAPKHKLLVHGAAHAESFLVNKHAYVQAVRQMLEEKTRP